MGSALTFISPGGSWGLDFLWPKNEPPFDPKDPEVVLVRSRWDSYEIRVRMPAGVIQDDICVFFRDGDLLISAISMGYGGSFWVKVPLKRPIQEDKIQMIFEEGLLSLFVPKVRKSMMNIF